MSIEHPTTVNAGWEAAFERDKHQVAAACHNAWVAEKIRQGYADHPFRGITHGIRARWCSTCFGAAPRAKHHPDMLDYDELSPDVQAYDLVTARVVYPLAFTAGHAAGAAEGYDTGYEAGSEAGYERCAEDRDQEGEATT